MLLPSARNEASKTLKIIEKSVKDVAIMWTPMWFKIGIVLVLNVMVTRTHGCTDVYYKIEPYSGMHILVIVHMQKWL